MRELTSTVTVDHSDRLRSIPDTRRDRTIHLRFLRLADGYLVQAWGSAFPHGGGGHQGRVLLGASTLEAGIDDLRARWRAALTDEGAGPTGRPFVDEWDLAGRDVDEAVRSLARAGHGLFALLFRHGDAGLDELRDRLLAAMRAGEHVVTVESDDLRVPWGLLYVPLDDHDPVGDDGHRWDPRGFWGYRHLIEHTSSRATGAGPTVPPGGTGLVAALSGPDHLGRRELGDHLPHRAASCLVEAQVDPPRAFAREYAARLADALSAPGATLGDVVRDLARAFLDEHRNPLGLIFSLRLGIDARVSSATTDR
ncbi:hypothetical protein [Saccharothrix texasensis]|uniref:Uncharacterized protein n=1 Tax=Saccharothrix texasensis TaxID=103734 RepID=A0A3N1HGS4_9PSEU|nr:hypothetical protein [Saccharothrix texasensis]ROP41708.1 hypothetical protein EDD40_7144 [Saccharothrix texasensis]